MLYFVEVGCNMTCIVGIIGDGKVYFGADSQGTSGYSRVMMKNEKVFKKTFLKKSKNSIEESTMIFGCSGSVRMTQIINHLFDIPEMNTELDEREYLVKVFVPDLIKCFSTNGYLKTISGEISNCYFMCGFNGKIFSLDDDFHVGEPIDKFYAMGHGKDYALGSMFTNIENKNTNYVQILTDALKASAAFDLTVGAPFRIESV